MKELEITKEIGQIEFERGAIYSCYYIKNTTKKITYTEAKANADLICDAFNTSNQCNLLPSELLKENKILMTALSVLLEEINEGAEINKTSQFFGSSERHLTYFRKALNQTK